MELLIVFASCIIIAFLLQLVFKKELKDFSRSIKLLISMDFEFMDTLVEQDVVQYGLLNLKFALVNDPKLIQRVLSSEFCLDKPRMIYKLLGTKNSLVSEPSKSNSMRFFFDTI